MTARLRSQEGWAVATALLVMAAMMALGLAAFAFVDGQVSQSGREKAQESTFNYSEGVLDAEAFLTGAKWPANTTGAFPDCTWNGSTLTAAGGGGNTALCPSPTELAQAFSAPDFSGPVTWTARIRDNGGTETCAVTAKAQCSYYYDDSVLASQPSWDANGDGQMWVRARLTLRGKVSTVVERVQLDRQQVAFPGSAITAGKFAFDTKGSPHNRVVTNYSPVNLRCLQSDPNCVIVQKKKQIAPYKFTFGYPGNTAIPSSALDLLRERAKTENSYYTTCPGTRPVGKLVFVESGNCTGLALPATSQTNQAVYIQASGTLTMDRNAPKPTGPQPKGPKPTGVFYGLIYLANGEGGAPHSSAANVFTMPNGARSLVKGVVAVDWSGGITVGGSKGTQLIYDPVALDSLWIYQGNTIVRPSFRQIKTSTP